MAEETKKERLAALVSQLKNERSSFIPHWRDLGDYVLPRRPRFYTSDVNRGDRRNQKIIDVTATLAARTLRSGMMAGVTSPARPWFRLTTPDASMAEFGPVKEWLHQVTQAMSTAFLRSNLYNVLPTIYGDLGVFGTAAMGIEEDFEDVSRFFSYPIGSYMISVNAKGKVDAFAREFRMTVRQIVERFCAKGPKGEIDFSNVSQAVQEAWKTNNREAWKDVVHVIAPNDGYQEDRFEAKFKRYTSCHYEPAGDNKILLGESGFDFFPTLCPRWETTGEDSYGTDCPGMSTLGDIKQLQLMERKGAKALDKQIDPPLSATASFKNVRVSLLPGEVTYGPAGEQDPQLKPIHEVDPPLAALEAKEDQIRGRVRRGFFEDLFLMLSMSDRRQITAREVEERYEEKLLALGPVLEQLNQDLLDPLIDAQFRLMERQGLIPTPPEEIQGERLKVEYISIMAQAQKLVGMSGVERFIGIVGELAKVDPTVIDKFDTDQTVDVCGDMMSVPPSMIRSDEKVQEIRRGRAEAERSAKEVESVRETAGAARDLSGADLSGDNALSRLLRTANAGQLVPQ